MTRAARRWVAARTPEAPPALALELARALDDGTTSAASGDESAAAVARVCLRAAEAALASVLAESAAEPAPARAAALTLLTADALVTYAFEAASDDPAAWPALAREAMASLSRIDAARAGS